MRIEAALRPFEVFDPANRRHREYYARYLKLGTWGYCPVRFAIQDDCNNLAASMQRELTEYYIKREFK